MYQLPKETVDKILGYLGTRPYSEVAGLIQDIARAVQTQMIAEKQAVPEVKKGSVDGDK